MTNFNVDQIQVLLGNGDGTFQSAQSFGTAFQPESLAVLDVNGDGNQDLAVACIEGSKVSVLLGNGDGTFRPAINCPAAGPWILGVADFNGDSAPDLVAGAGGGLLNTVLLNSGGSSVTTTSSSNLSQFTEPATFTIAVTPSFSSIGTPTGTVTFKDEIRSTPTCNQCAAVAADFQTGRHSSEFAAGHCGPLRLSHRALARSQNR